MCVFYKKVWVQSAIALLTVEITGINLIKHRRHYPQPDLYQPLPPLSVHEMMRTGMLMKIKSLQFLKL